MFGHKSTAIDKHGTIEYYWKCKRCGWKSEWKTCRSLTWEGGT